jgi:hypothetical protein
MDHFSYHSEQVHSEFKKGKGQTRRNSVSIKDGKGKKAVEVFSAEGKVLSRKEKTLTASELECIKRNKFIPGLFKDCVKPLTLSLRSAQKTRRRNRK